MDQKKPEQCVFSSVHAIPEGVTITPVYKCETTTNVCGLCYVGKDCNAFKQFEKKKA